MIQTLARDMTHKESFNRRHGLKADATHSLDALSKLSGVKKSCLKEVYDRGKGAHKTNPDSVRTKATGAKYVHVKPSMMAKRKLSAEQWAMARVYAYLDKREDPKQTLNHDTDVCKKKKK